LPAADFGSTMQSLRHPLFIDPRPLLASMRESAKHADHDGSRNQPEEYRKATADKSAEHRERQTNKHDDD
jgi:hypothetical protein